MSEALTPGTTMLPSSVIMKLPVLTAVPAGSQFTDSPDGLAYWKL